MTASSTAKTEDSGLANLAALLTWLVPGAGHLLLGRTATAVACFVVIEGLFWGGLQLTGGMTIEYLDHELRTFLAPALAPEAGNLGGFLYQMKFLGWVNYPRPWPELIRVGGLLTGLSGILNIVAMCHAHLIARTRLADLDAKGLAPVFAMGATWLVPGLGHVLQGRRARGVAVFVALVGLFALGTFLAEGSNLSRERHYYYWSGQFMLGLPAIVAELAAGDLRITGRIPYVDAGLVFGCVAGLLNILAMIDVYAFGEARLLGLPQKTLHADGGGAKQEATA
jgi:hypothetical protein